MDNNLTAQEVIEEIDREVDNDQWGSLMNLGFQYAMYCHYDRDWKDSDAAKRVDRILYDDMRFRPGAGKGEPEDMDLFRTETLPCVAVDSDLIIIGEYLNAKLDAVPEESRY